MSSTSNWIGGNPMNGWWGLLKWMEEGEIMTFTPENTPYRDRGTYEIGETIPLAHFDNAEQTKS